MITVKDTAAGVQIATDEHDTFLCEQGAVTSELEARGISAGEFVDGKMVLPNVEASDLGDDFASATTGIARDAYTQIIAR